MKAYEALNVDQIVSLRILADTYYLKEGVHNMHWTTPNKEYTFYINRTENRLHFSTTTESAYPFNYIVEITVCDSIGNCISKMKSTEIGVITILDSLLNFSDEDMMHFEPYSSYTIQLDPSSAMIMPTICVLRDGNIYGKIEETVPDDQFPVNHYLFNDDLDEFREIVFSIDHFDMTSRRTVTVVRFNLCDYELEEFCFILFFGVLIDIDVPPKYMSDIEYIASRLLDNMRYDGYITNQ